MDLVSTAILIFCGIPSLVFIMGSIYLFKFYWIPKSWLGYTGISMIMIVLFWIAGYLFSFAWRV
ncbi:hypothetical protein C2I18_27230 [Paenibacillus sp. PK3_47]|nr:hypothetical protein C2I18_27230 [Paenibacillus sp. PK3_47]